MKNKVLFRVFLILTIAWMILIFSFSAKNAEESDAASMRVGYWIGSIVHADFDDWPPEAQDSFAEKINYPIRKGAHASEYAVLGILIVCCIASSGMACAGQRGLILPAWILTTLYACTDEFHQLFVPGRSGQITDVGIDSAGALIGCAVIVWILRMRKRSLRR